MLFTHNLFTLQTADGLSNSLHTDQAFVNPLLIDLLNLSLHTLFISDHFKLNFELNQHQQIIMEGTIKLLNILQSVDNGRSFLLPKDRKYPGDMKKPNSMNKLLEKINISSNKFNQYNYQQKENENSKLITKFGQSQRLTKIRNPLTQLKIEPIFRQLKQNPVNNTTNIMKPVAGISTIRGHLIKQNQDIAIATQNIMILCDGHGKQGKKVAEFVSEALKQSFVYMNRKGDITKDQSKIKNSITQIFCEINEELSDQEIGVAMSGCTSNVVLIYNDLIVSANCGDSRTFLISGGLMIELSIQHNPMNEQQRKRVQLLGGIVKRHKDFNKQIGPLRVYLKQSNQPGLAVSRSFGDTIGKQCGIISKPQIRIWNRSPSDKFLIIGSDGLFQYFRPEQMKDFCYNQLKKGITTQQMSNMLTLEAKARWKSIQHDDITCIFMNLEN